MRRISAALAVACLTIVLSACGGADDGKTGAEATPKPNPSIPLSAHLIGPEDLEKTKPDRPERALLEFWQAVQFENEDKAYRLLSKQATDGMTRAEFDEAVELAAPRFNSRPQIIQPETSGSTAYVGVNLLFYDTKGKVIAITPTTFSLVEEDGQWRLADLEYFEERVAAGREAARD